MYTLFQDLHVVALIILIIGGPLVSLWRPLDSYPHWSAARGQRVMVFNTYDNYYTFIVIECPTLTT